MTDENIENNQPGSTNKPTLTIIQKFFISFAIIFVTAIIAVIMLYAYYLSQISKPIQAQEGEEEISLAIERGMGTVQIGNYFTKLKLIDRPEILRAYLLLNPSKSIQAGYYSISAKDLTLETLVDQLQEGSFEIKLTFIEGWRVEEYRDYLEKQVSKEFADAFINSDFIEEGYMFPDTYIIDRDYEPENLASTMRNTFKKRFSDDLIDQAGLNGLSVDEVVILASIVEREMNISKERPTVAGILIKRLKNNWALQADATLQYAKGTSENWWPKVGRSEYQSLDSPYNTYKNKGLPPAPICNPSLDSIKAVVNYVDSPYWFYITGTDGITRYSETLEEHNEKVATYL